MTTTLETTADTIIQYGNTLRWIDGAIEFAAATIANLAAEGDTDSHVFTGAVENYRQLKAKRETTQAAYDAALEEA